MQKHNLPLAETLRPSNINDVIGQQHIIGDGQPLRVAIETKNLPSMILWGPPGVGKTTLAHVISESSNYEFLEVSAVLSGVKEIREAVEKAKMLLELQSKKTILFVDEVHRFNKSQQDAFLPHIESGLITFIGATTENPSFEVNKALLSRCQVFTLKSLTQEELGLVVSRVLKHYDHYKINDAAKKILLDYASGDARRLINIIEIIFQRLSSDNSDTINNEIVKKVITNKSRSFDKGGEQFYDQISALQKSVRGSNPDAAIFWLFKMIDGGADPLYLARRILRIAIEDIGLADLRAQTIALEAYQIYERLGFPEGELALNNAVIYLSMAPKSNSAYVAYNEVKSFVEDQRHYDVPLHLRNAPTQLMRELNYGKDYRYAHNEPHGYAAGEKYFPDEVEPVEFYKPTDRGLEKKISEKKDFLKKLDSANEESKDHD
ncbi:MAG: replication-associated recombination protein A [Methylophilaceae bacterium]|nr:replication-associated recombination protein A [Methylophilaceae bacterium]MBL6726801.1 replication-associated recombination protein A [Methylophilaceae bacterium]MBL6791302.1 replication-associated recombination protein A [Methylophilaceae bacterium]